MKPHFAMMARYNAWANARLYAEARAVSEESYRKDVDTDRIWMRRFTGQGEHPSKLNAIMLDLPSLEAVRRAEDARIILYVEGLSADASIQFVIDHPVTEVIQQDGRIRRWAVINEAEGKYLRVILLADGETVHERVF